MAHGSELGPAPANGGTPAGPPDRWHADRIGGTRIGAGGSQDGSQVTRGSELAVCGPHADRGWGPVDWMGHADQSWGAAARDAHMSGYLNKKHVLARLTP